MDYGGWKPIHGLIPNEVAVPHEAEREANQV
jgi:hypothetical protein